MDAITLLKNDHRTVEQLFKKFERAGERAYKTKRKIVDQIIEELSIHAEIEESLFYPATRSNVEAGDEDVLESLEEHHVVKWTLSELEDMDPKDERFDAKATVLIESVRHHVKEEEQQMFPKVRKAMSRSDLAELGERMEKAKTIVPSRPHPRSPDEPPAKLAAAPAAALIDKGREAVETVRERLTGS